MVSLACPQLLTDERSKSVCFIENIVHNKQGDYIMCPRPGDNPRDRRDEARESIERELRELREKEERVRQSLTEDIQLIIDEVGYDEYVAACLR